MNTKDFTNPIGVSEKKLYEERKFFMSIYPYVVLLEIIGENELLVYSGKKCRNYLIQVSRERADFYREKLTALEKNEEILFKFDEDSETIRSFQLEE